MAFMGPVDSAPFSFWDNSRQTALALGAVLRRDPEGARRGLEYFRPRAGYFLPSGSAGMASDAILGLLCATLGDLDEAVAHLGRALEFCRAHGLRPALAWGFLDYADALARRVAPGDRDRAMELLGEGLALARELGMRPLLGKMEKMCRRLGFSPAAAEGQGNALPDGLTGREVEVLRQLVCGFTNREIAERLYISPHTVARHMHNIFDKTGMANRAEVTAYAIRQGLVESP